MIPLTSVLNALKEGVGGYREKVIIIRFFCWVFVPLILSFFNLGSIERDRLFENLRLMFVFVLFYILCLG